jgi:RNA polymerase primary sigma factor
MKDVSRITLLTNEEEKALAVQAAKGDKVAAETLVKANLRFVVKVAAQFKNRGLDLDDLISEGNIGLMTAVQHFDVKKGYKFITYAVWWIRQSIMKAIADKSRAIRIPQNWDNDLHQVRKARAAKTIRFGENDAVGDYEKIAQKLGMKGDHVKDLLTVTQEPVSLDAEITSNNPDGVTMEYFLEDTRNSGPEEKTLTKAMREEIGQVLAALPPKEAAVLKYRYGLDGSEGMSLSEVSARLHLTKERIRQIEKQAIVHLRSPRKRARLEGYVA